MQAIKGEIGGKETFFTWTIDTDPYGKTDSIKV